MGQSGINSASDGLLEETGFYKEKSIAKISAQTNDILSNFQWQLMTIKNQPLLLENYFIIQ